MRVLFINPPVTTERRLADPLWGPPLSLAYLAAVAGEEGHQPVIIDCLGKCPIPITSSGGSTRYGLSGVDLLSSIRDFEPQIVGIACPYHANSADALETAELVKRQYSADVPVVMGGAYASVRPGPLLESGYVDYVVVGEGERTLVELCSRLDSGSLPGEVAGLLQRGTDGSVIGGPRRERITELDSLPYPRRDLLPMAEYFKIDRMLRWRSVTDMRLPKTSMITSRGCPEDCVFCAIRCTWGRKWVGRSPENIIDEIELLVEEFGIREINFLDDSISVSGARLRKICELIIERGIDFKWVPSSGIAIRTLDADLLRLMKRSGCYRLSFGLESGDRDTLDFVRKRYTYDHAIDTIRAANRMGIWTTGTFIVGFPYETAEQMERTIKYAIGSGVDLAFMYCAVPYPGTDLMDICLEEGIDVPESADLWLGGVGSLEMSAAEILSMREEGNTRFLRSRLARPWKILGKVRSFEDLVYLLRVIAYSGRLVLPSPCSRRARRA